MNGKTSMVRTEIEIDASDELVWQVLTDFEAYPEWNPFIHRASGRAKPGALLEVAVAPPGAREMTVRPIVLWVEPRRELRWAGRLLLPGSYDGEHSYLIEPLGPNRVRLVHQELFEAEQTPAVMQSLVRREKLGFEEMNQALKTRAEELR